MAGCYRGIIKRVFACSSGPCVSPLVRRLGWRLVAVVAAAANAAGAALSALVPHPWMLFGTYSLIIGEEPM